MASRPPSTQREKVKREMGRPPTFVTPSFDLPTGVRYVHEMINQGGKGGMVRKKPVREVHICIKWNVVQEGGAILPPLFPRHSLSSLPSYHATIWKNRLSRASFGKRYRRDQQPLLGFGRSFENRSADCVPFPWSSMPSGLTASPKFQGISPSPLSQCPPTFASHTTPELWQKSGEPLTQFFFQFMARPGVSLSPFSFFSFYQNMRKQRSPNAPN